MKKSFKFVSLLLTLCMCISVLSEITPITVVASDLLYDTSNISTEQFIAPDIVEEAEVIERGYIGRLEDAEKDLYTFVFQNNDGTNTMRVYSHPVKYVADNGSIRDISLDVKAKKEGGFVTADHEIITTFGKKLANGISLEYHDIEIMLVPDTVLGTDPVAVLSSDDKIVTYGKNDITSFVYELTYAGFKEDIVVNEYTGQTEYEFTIYTNGLTLYEEYGSYYLVDSDGNVKATIGDIIVFTADEQNNTMGSMTYETIRENQEYTLTIHLDADYLSDEATVYPIRIDPTIEINYDSNGSGAIEDVTINSLQGSDGSSGSLFVGKRATYGISRTLMKFPGLNLNSIASADCITSAYVEIRDVLCEGEAMTVFCYPFTGNAWSESTADWSNVSPDSFGSLLSSKSISYSNGVNQTTAHRYQFGITSAVKKWKSGEYSQAKGIIFKASSSIENGSTNINKTFASYNRSSERPSLSITYNVLGSGIDYLIAFQSDGKILSSTSSYTLAKGTYAASSEYQKWVFIEVSSGIYTIRMKNNLSKGLTAVASSSTVIISDITSGNTNQYWSIDTNGPSLKCRSSNTSVKDKKLLYSGGSFTLSSSSYSSVGFFNLSYWSNGTAMSVASIDINVGSRKATSVTYTPTNSIGKSANWSTYSTSNASVFTVDSSGYVTGVGAGTATLTVKNRITGMSCTATVRVTRLPNPDGQNKDNWCWAACAKMVGEHNGGNGKLNTGASYLTDTSGLHSYNGSLFYGESYNFRKTVDAGQRQIVVAVHGDDGDHSGSNDDKEQALQLASLKNMTIGTIGSSSLSTANITTMNNELAVGRWVIGNVFTVSDWGGHSIVIQSYNSDTGVYTFWDPWTNTTSTFTRTQLLNNTIHTASSTADRVMAWVQYCR